MNFRQNIGQKSQYQTINSINFHQFRHLYNFNFYYYCMYFVVNITTEDVEINIS